MNGIFTLETLLTILILFIYTISGSIFQKYKFHYIHESGLCMLLGVIITLFAGLIDPEKNFSQNLKFNDQVFFTFILPPMIFAAGYNLRRRTFFRYFLYIFIFGILGTLVTFSVVAPLTYLTNRAGIFKFTFKQNVTTLNDTESGLKLKDNKDAKNSGKGNKTINDNNLLIYRHLLESAEEPKPTSTMNVTNADSNDYNNTYNLDFSLSEILLFSSVISATDTVAALTFVNESNEPKLFSIMLGEGVVNDAVCIVLYKIIQQLSNTGTAFSAGTFFEILGKFLYMFICSFLVGAFIGMFASLFLKILKPVNMSKVQETCSVILFGYISYTLSEEIGLSPIISLLFTGIFLSHYGFYNLSYHAREESSILTKMLGNITEAFVFTYLGLTLTYYMTKSFSLSFILFELFFVTLGRFITIYSLSFLFGLCKLKSFNILPSQKGVLFYTGSIRGAIAFGLAISITTENVAKKNVLVSSTLILVFFTTLVYGALMPFAIKFFKSRDGEVSQENDPENKASELIEESSINNDMSFSYTNPNYSKEKDKLKKDKKTWFGNFWRKIDNMLKPFLIDNWPTVKHENEEITNRIRQVFEDYNDKLKSFESSKAEDLMNGNFGSNSSQKENLLVHSSEKEENGKPVVSVNKT